jgi:hypothetical protein
VFVYSILLVNDTRNKITCKSSNHDTDTVQFSLISRRSVETYSTHNFAAIAFLVLRGARQWGKHDDFGGRL